MKRNSDWPPKPRPWEPYFISAFMLLGVLSVSLGIPAGAEGSMTILLLFFFVATGNQIRNLYAFVDHPDVLEEHPRLRLLTALSWMVIAGLFVLGLILIAAP